jgi:hypothetical protein
MVSADLKRTSEGFLTAFRYPSYHLQRLGITDTLACGRRFAESPISATTVGL